MPASVRQSPADCAKLAKADALLHKQGDLAGAIAIYRDVLKRFPADPELLYHVGSAELMAGNLADARKRLARSVKARPAASTWRALAKVSELSGDIVTALDEIQQGLALAPDDPALLAAKADALFAMGEFDAAHALLLPLIEADEVHPGVVSAFARLAPRVDRAADGVRLIDRCIDDASPQEQAVMAFRLAALLDALGEHDRAFAAAVRANALRDFRFDASAFDARIDEAIANWPGVDVDASLAGTPVDLVFIVGMPRSGTSLAEQIIAAHDGVVAGGERPHLARLAIDLGAEPTPPPILTTPAKLTSKGIARAAARFIRDTGQRGGMLTDKMPTNFLHVGLIVRLFPSARIVHCIRDPRDTCVSCFFQSFAEGLPFAGDLAHLATVQNAERRLMAHWKATHDMPIFDLVYEDLVVDLPGVARDLIGFLGLDWQDACATPWLSSTIAATASIDQVRRPVYTSSVGRWRNYESHLATLLDNLDER